MIAALARKFDELERSRELLLQQIAQYNPAQLHYRPAHASWSILEVVHHLVLAEHFAAAYIEKKMNNPAEVRRLPFGASLRSGMLIMAMRSPFRFKAPSPRVLPAANVSLPEVLQHWHELRRKWAELLQRVTPEMLGLALYRHPVAGLLTIAHAVTFQQEHFNHHLQQIHRIRTTPNFPVSSKNSN